MTPPLPDDARATLPLPNTNDDSRVTLPLAGEAETVPQVMSTKQEHPEKIGRFVIRTKLGEGAFGAVYRAFDPQLEREVALKVAKPGAVDSPERRERFAREAKSAAGLRHPNIVPVYDSGEDAGQFYIASGFVDGRTLRDEIDVADGQPLNLHRAAVVIRKLAEALGYAHKKGIVHRDVKPENVLVDTEGEPQVADFGLAARAGEGELAAATSGEAGESLKTRDGRVLGTPAYMSPEQAAGRSAEATAAADQYALGIMLYELATGRRPFEGPSEVVLFNHISVTPKPPRSVNPSLPRDLEAVILKCLAKEPTLRYANCEALGEDLRRFLDREPVIARRIGATERLTKWAKRNPLVAGSLTTAVLALGIGMGVSLWQRDEARGSAKIAEGKTEEAKNEAIRANNAAISEAAQKKIAEKNADEVRKEAKENRRMLDLSRLREAQVAFENNLVQTARDILEDIHPENRCAVWGILNRRFEGSLFTMWGHRTPLNSVAMSGDGTRVVTGIWDLTTDPPLDAERSARVWDGKTGEFLFELKGHAGQVTSVAITPDGTRIVTGSLDQTVRIWDGETGRHLAEFSGQNYLVMCVAISSDGRRVAAGSGGGIMSFQPNKPKTARVWDVSSGRCLFDLTGHSGGVSSLALSADGDRIITGSEDGRARLWDGNTGKSLMVLKGSGLNVSGVAMSADRKSIVGASGATALVWDARTGAVLQELKGHAGQITGAVLSEDGSRIATSARDRTARVWDATTGETLFELKGHVGAVSGVAMSADGRRIVTASYDKTARMWDGRSGEPFVGILDDRAAGVVAIEADGKYVVTGTHEGVVRTWDAHSGRSLRRFDGHLQGITCLAVCAAGGRIVSGSADSTARLWDANTGRCIKICEGHKESVTCVATSADGATFATGSLDGTIRVWSSVNGACLRVYSDEYFRITGVSLSANGNILAASSMNGMAYIFDTTNDRSPHQLKGHKDSVTCTAVSANGEFVATGSDDKTTRLWETRSGRMIDMKEHAKPVTCVAWNDDGSRLFTGNGTHESTIPLIRSVVVMTVWDVKSGQSIFETRGRHATAGIATASLGKIVAIVSEIGEVCVRHGAPSGNIQVLSGHKDKINSIETDSTGGRLVTASRDGTARLWDALSARLIFEFGGHPSFVMQASFTPDGTGIITVDMSGKQLVWDATTGERLPGSGGYVKQQPIHVLRDGRLAVATGDRVALVDSRIDSNQKAMRQTRFLPCPAWHQQLAEQFAYGKRPFAAAMQRSFEQHARGMLAVEALDFDKAQAHFITAALLKPKPPKPLEELPAPRLISR